MRIKFAKYGRREMAVVLAFSAAAAAAMVLTLPTFLWWFLVLPVLLSGLVLYFFRDPERNIPTEGGVLVAPADGCVTDIETCPEDDWLGEEAGRVSIFLSALDVHLNRAPCEGTVEKIRYRKGRFFNAMRKRSARENERNDVCIRISENGEKMLVRQIAGVLARRIVCDCSEGKGVERGQIIGMIKLGSRTDLFVPARLNVEFLVSVGDHVKAGETILGRFV